MTENENVRDGSELAQVAQRLRDNPRKEAYLVISGDSLFYDRRHMWVTFDPTTASPFIYCKREEHQSALFSRSEFRENLVYPADYDDGEVVLTRFVELDRTPIPYHDAPLVEVRCPYCPDTSLTVREPLADRPRDCNVCGSTGVEPVHVE